MRIVVSITGATGAIYAVKLLKVLKQFKVEVHLIMSQWARNNISYETGISTDQIRNLASYCYEENNLAASVSSGSFQHQGMVVIPCSMKTLAGIAHGYSSNLIIRAADVTLKENRKLILVPRETPLNAIHLENMLILARLGVTIMPPMPAFYYQPKTIDDIVDHLIGRILDQLGIEHDLVNRWNGCNNPCFVS